MQRNRSLIDDLKYQFRFGNMVTKLIFVNIGVFVLQGILYLIFWSTEKTGTYFEIIDKFSVPAKLKTLLFQPWSLISYQFLHSISIWHILFNMLWFYWFGRIFLTYQSEKKVLPIYIYGGLAGAFLYILAYNLLPALNSGGISVYLLGASASVLAIVIATATLVPNHQIYLIFLGGVKIKYIALVSVILDVLTIPKGNAGGHIAHLGGAAFGFFYMRSLQSGSDWSVGFNKFFDKIVGIFGEIVDALKFKPRSRQKVVYKNKQKAGSKSSNVSSTAQNLDKQAKVDAILDKIARSGYDSLSKEEKEFLFKFSKEDS